MPSAPSYSNKEVFQRFFTAHPRENAAWVCKECPSSSAPIKQNIKNGYKNIVSHLQNKHPGYLEAMDGGQQTRLPSKLRGKATSVLGWIRLVTLANQPLSITENPYFLAVTSLQPISRRSLGRCMVELTRAVEEKIKTELPAKFGIVMDCWTDNGTHYACMFAAYPSAPKPVMLAFTPFGNETSWAAADHKALIQDTLAFYGKSMESVAFLTADNTATNPLLARMLGVPFVGCFSHRMNLAVNLMLRKYEPLLDKVGMQCLTL